MLNKLQTEFGAPINKFTYILLICIFMVHNVKSNELNQPPNTPQLYVEEVLNLIKKKCNN